VRKFLFCALAGAVLREMLRFSGETQSTAEIVLSEIAVNIKYQKYNNK
jgi:hypothetical protein